MKRGSDGLWRTVGGIVVTECQQRELNAMPKPTDDQIIQFVNETVDANSGIDTHHAITLVMNKYDITALDVAVAYHNITSGAPAATEAVEEIPVDETQDEAEQEAIRLEQEENAKRAAELAAAATAEAASSKETETSTVDAKSETVTAPIDLSLIDPSASSAPADTKKKK